MTTKIIHSLAYGNVIWRKIATMSLFTFDVDNPDEFAHWNKAHPKAYFTSMSVERTDQEGVFHVWLPLLEDNADWKMPEDRYQKKVPKVLPIAYDHNTLTHWLNFSRPFLVELFVDFPE